MIRLLLCLFSFFAFAISSSAQSDSIRLHLKIIDSFSRETVEGVSVIVYEQDSTTVLRNGMRRGLVYSDDNVASVDDYYTDLPRRPSYVVKIGHMDYEEQTIRIVVPKRRLSRKVKEWYPKNIIIRKKSSAFERSLDEVAVTASRVAMVVKGDTVEYDARAFRLAEGSMLDNLMAMLPGVTLTEKGEIYINGKYVQKLMVNGRDFFNGNPKVALDNLPAYTVDKIRAYHEGPEWAHLIDENNVDYSKRPMVVDVRLKREYAQGWLANIETGGGTRTQGGWDEVYLGRLFAMRYTDHSGLALYGSLNNLGDNQSPGRKGEWKKMDVTQGERTVKVGGVNLDIDGKRTGTKFSSTLEARREDILSQTFTTSVSGEGAVRQMAQHDYNGEIGQTDVKWDGKITTKSRLTFFEIKPSVKYMHNKRQEETLGATHVSYSENDSWRHIYTRNLSYTMRGDDWITGGTVMGHIKSPLSGKNYSISFTANYNHTDRKNIQKDRLLYTDKAMNPENWKAHRRDVLPEKAHDYKASISRNILDWKNKGFSYRMELSYNYRQDFKQGERTRELEQLPEGSVLTVLPSAETEEQWQIDNANTYRTKQKSHRHNPALSVSLGNNKIIASGNLYANFEHRSINDMRNLTPRSDKRKDFFLSFDGWMNISPLRMQLQYFYNPQLPSMLHLLDVRDAADPMNIYLGNSALKKSVSHFFMLSHSTSKQKRQRTFYAGLQGEVIADAVGNARNYNAQTGVTTYQPRNICGNHVIQPCRLHG